MLLAIWYMKFYNNSISSCVKITPNVPMTITKFYNNSISSGVKIFILFTLFKNTFYNNSISSGVKIKVDTYLRKAVLQ